MPVPPVRWAEFAHLLGDQPGAQDAEVVRADVILLSGGGEFPVGGDMESGGGAGQRLAERPQHDVGDVGCAVQAEGGGQRGVGVGCVDEDHQVRVVVRVGMDRVGGEVGERAPD